VRPVSVMRTDLLVFHELVDLSSVVFALIR
jgi:hypothetical protein